jgi:hypothetical protein
MGECRSEMERGERLLKMYGKQRTYGRIFGCVATKGVSKRGEYGAAGVTTLILGLVQKRELRRER